MERAFLMLFFSSFLMRKIGWEKRHKQSAISKVCERCETKVNVNQFDKIYDQPFWRKTWNLVHFASGAIATATICDDTKSMFDKGETVAVEYLQTHYIQEMSQIFITNYEIKATNVLCLEQKVPSRSKRGEIVATPFKFVAWNKIFLLMVIWS